MLPESSKQHQASALLDGHRFDLHILEFTVSALAHALDAFGNLNSAILYAATARACGPFDQTPGRKRPVSINALAASLGRPFETTRRHASALIEDGLIARAPSGLSVTIESLTEPRVARLTDSCHDLLVSLIEDLGGGGFALPSPATDISYDPRSGVGIALDLLLAAIESHGRREENFTRLALLLAIEWAHRRFAYAGPEGATDPVIRTSTAARILGLPYATTSRNIDALVDRGLLTRAGAGLRPVNDARLAVEGRAALANRARQLIGRLAQCGFPMQQPATAYIRHRTPPPDLG
jgi:DNA-binding MarR family transcriptional regulator